MDYAGARPFPLPRLGAGAAVAPQQGAPSSQSTLGAPALLGESSPGDGQLKQLRIAPAQPEPARPPRAGQVVPNAQNATGNFARLPGQQQGSGGFSSQQAGTQGRPFSTSRVQLQPLATAPVQQPTVYSFPYRASGKLFFRDGASTYVCSASLIRRGLVVTAAHCVAPFGGRRFYSNFQFVPAYHNGLAPFGVWNAAPGGAFVVNSYYTGSEACAFRGVVCPNDVAVIRLAPQSNPVFPGTSTGWFSVGVGNWGFTSAGKTLVNQLGYPVALDNGQQEQRNDSQGERVASFSNNTVIGSLMTGGSSGGPWLNNLGLSPALNGTSFGTASTANVVIGVTSWGYVDSGPKEQGASPFTAGNITALVNMACGNPVNQAACR